MTVIGLILAVTFQQLAPAGHMLWLTAWSFLFGAANRTGITVPTAYAAPAMVVLVGILLLLHHVVGSSMGNFAILSTISH